MLCTFFRFYTSLCTFSGLPTVETRRQWPLLARQDPELSRNGRSGFTITWSLNNRLKLPTQRAGISCRTCEPGWEVGASEVFFFGAPRKSAQTLERVKGGRLFCWILFTTPHQGWGFDGGIEKGTPGFAVRIKNTQSGKWLHVSICYQWRGTYF